MSLSNVFNTICAFLEQSSDFPSLSITTIQTICAHTERDVHWEVWQQDWSQKSITQKDGIQVGPEDGHLVNIIIGYGEFKTFSSKIGKLDDDGHGVEELKIGPIFDDGVRKMKLPFHYCFNADVSSQMLWLGVTDQHGVCHGGTCKILKGAQCLLIERQDLIRVDDTQIVVPYAMEGQQRMQLVLSINLFAGWMTIAVDVQKPERRPPMRIVLSHNEYNYADRFRLQIGLSSTYPDADKYDYPLTGSFHMGNLLYFD